MERTRRHLAIWSIILLSLVWLSGCSSDTDASDIADELSDRLTDALDFEDGVVEDGEPPEGESGEEIPQIDDIDGTDLRLGAAFAFSLQSGFAAMEDVSRAIVWVKGASKYIVVQGGLSQGIFELFGRLTADAELRGKPFELHFALQTENGITGQYQTYEITVLDEDPQQASVGSDIEALVIENEDEFESGRPNGKGGSEMPQIAEVAGPESLWAGASFELSLSSDFEGDVRSVIVSTPGNVAYKRIPASLTEGVVHLKGQLSDKLEIGDQWTFLLALEGDSGAGLYRSWSLVVVEPPAVSDGDQEIDGDVVIDGDKVVDGDVETDGDVIIDGDVEADGDVVIDGDTDADGDFVVDGDDEIDGDQVIDGDVETDGDIVTDGDLDEEKAEEDPDEEEESDTVTTPPIPIWANGYGSSGSNDLSKAVAIAPDGSTYFLGDFDSTLQIDGTQYTSAGLQDLILIKLKPNGDPDWVKQFGSTGTENGVDLTVDSMGNLILTGTFTSGFSFTADTTGYVQSNGGLDIYLAKFEADGTFTWAKSFGGTDFDGIQDVATDSADNIYITGQYKGTINFGTTVNSEMTSHGGNDIYLAKFNSSGDLQWSKGYGNSGSYQDGMALALDGTESVILGGYFSGDMDVGGNTLPEEGLYDIFVAKYATDTGRHIWSHVYGDADDEMLNGVAVGQNGQVIVTGYFNGTITFDDTLTSTGGADLFYAVLDSDGSALSSRQYGDGSNQFGGPVHTDSQNRIIWAGGFSGTLDFGLDSPMVSPGGSDIFLVLFEADGSIAWGKAFGNTSTNTLSSLALGGEQRIAIGGIYQGWIEFVPGQGLPIYGNRDMFAATFRYPPTANTP